VAHLIQLRVEETDYCEYRKSHACLTTFNAVCSYIGTRDLVQEHIAFKVWILTAEWEMPKDVEADTSQNAGKSSLVHLASLTMTGLTPSKQQVMNY
jgi:hypothetical protein